MRLTLEELELLDIASVYNTTQHNNICGKATMELIEYKKIEKELGIDFITLFKALLNGIYYKGAYGTNNYGKIVYQEHPTIFFDTMNKLYYFKSTFFDFIYLIQYGKTWSLDKEELE